MPDRNTIADRQRNAWVRVQHAGVLDIASLADLQPVIIAAQYTVEPHTATVAKSHAADDGCILGNKVTAAFQNRLAVTQRNIRCAPLLDLSLVLRDRPLR